MFLVRTRKSDRGILRVVIGGSPMQEIRCQCGKIVCQVINTPGMPKVVATPRTDSTGPSAVILCRHCKRYVVLQVPAVTCVAYASAVPVETP
jgi:hypothetical protein